MDNRRAKEKRNVEAAKSLLTLGEETKKRKADTQATHNHPKRGKTFKQVEQLERRVSSDQEDKSNDQDKDEDKQGGVASFKTEEEEDDEDSVVCLGVRNPNENSAAPCKPDLNDGDRQDEIKELPFVEIFEDVLKKLSSAQQKEARDFYGHLKAWFEQQETALDDFDPERINRYLTKFEAALAKVRNAQESHKWIFRKGVKHVINQCKGYLPLIKKDEDMKKEEE